MKYTTDELILAAHARGRAVELFDLAITEAKERGEDMDEWYEKNSPYDFISDAVRDFEDIAEQIRQERSRQT